MRHTTEGTERRGRAKPDPTFDRTTRPTKTIHSVARQREVNTQSYAAGTKPMGGGYGPSMETPGGGG